MLVVHWVGSHQSLVVVGGAAYPIGARLNLKPNRVSQGSSRCCEKLLEKVRGRTATKQQRFLLYSLARSFPFFTGTLPACLKLIMSFGGQTPTIVVLREGQFTEMRLEMVVLIFSRNGPVTRSRTDTVEHQRMFSCAVDY
jgi:hypothetical protein